MVSASLAMVSPGLGVAGWGMRVAALQARLAVGGCGLDCRRALAVRRQTCLLSRALLDEGLSRLRLIRFVALLKAT